MKDKGMSLTGADFRLLMDLLEIAEWVLHAYRHEPPVETGPYRVLMQKIYAQAEALGVGELVAFERRLQEYVPSQAYEQSTGIMPFVDRFVEDSFWQELAGRLAERDLVEQVGEDVYERMSEESRMRELQKLEDWYWQEFSAHGVDNLSITADSRETGPTVH